MFILCSPRALYIQRSGNAALKSTVSELFWTFNLYSYWLDRDNQVASERAEEQNVPLLQKKKKKSRSLRYVQERQSFKKTQILCQERVNKVQPARLCFSSLVWVVFLPQNWIISIWRRTAASSCRGLTGMVKSINERYCILSSPASLGMHVCMLNIWICIGIEHLLPELAASQRCAWNNNLADKWTALFFLLSAPPFAFRRVIEKDNKYFNFIAKLILNVNLRPTELWLTLTYYFIRWYLLKRLEKKKKESVSVACLDSFSFLYICGGGAEPFKTRATK